MDSPRQRLNDHRYRQFAGDGSASIAFVCECGHPDCLQTVVLTGSEYRLVRPGPILHGEHDVAGVPAAHRTEEAT